MPVRCFPAAARPRGGGKAVWPFACRRFAQNLLTSPRSLAIIQRHPAKAPPFCCPPPAGEGHTVPLRPGRGSAGIAQLVEQLIRNQQVACFRPPQKTKKRRGIHHGSPGFAASAAWPPRSPPRYGGLGLLLQPGRGDDGGLAAKKRPPGRPRDYSALAAPPKQHNAARECPLTVRAALARTHPRSGL